LYARKRPSYLCKMRGRDEPNRSHYNFKQNLIQSSSSTMISVY
jgi:hypothetical protein